RLTKLALHSFLYSVEYDFCLIVQFSKFVRACFGDSIRIPSLKQEVNNFFEIVFYLFAVSARPLKDMN
ncbi:hypothetical protein ACHFI2_16070, partial [Exiguobacterium acetylicum]|uniref:hypothetical protein n=2 Tax=Exiguobacterium TaxID=33986 RepID=UPI003876876D